MIYRIGVVAFLVAALALLSGCMSAYKKSLGGDTAQVFDRIYITDFNTAWQSALDALKSNRRESTNREAGFIQTRWTENTAEKNFIDSYAGTDSFLKSKYRVRVVLAKGNYSGKPSVKVSVFKEQLVQRDLLDGWKAVETDSIDEHTLLYRIGRLIAIRTKIAQIEDARTKKAILENGSM